MYKFIQAVKNLTTSQKLNVLTFGIIVFLSYLYLTQRSIYLEDLDVERKEAFRLRQRLVENYEQELKENNELRIKEAEQYTKDLIAEKRHCLDKQKELMKKIDKKLNELL